MFFDMHHPSEDPLDRFRHVADHSFDHIVITDTSGYVVYANKAASHNTGYAISEMVGSKSSLWGRQMSSDFYRRMWRTIKHEKKNFESEITNRRKNGEIYQAQIHISPVVDHGGAITYYASIERDISEQAHGVREFDHLKRKYELTLSRLTQKEDHFRTTLLALPTPILIADTEGVVLFTNDAFRAIDKSIPDPIGACIHDVVRLLELNHTEIPCCSGQGIGERLFVCVV